MNFSNPLILILIPITIVGLYYLLKKDFVKINNRYADEKNQTKKLRRRRIWLFISRAIILSLLLIAIAGPVIQLEEFIDTDPSITILEDASNSMQFYDTTQAEEIIQEIESQVPVERHQIGSGNESAIADDVLGYLSEGRNLIVLSDGQVTSGASLASVASFASSLEATLNTIELPSKNQEASTYIHGPKYVIQDTQETWTVNVESTTQQAVSLEVLIDGEVVMQEETTAAQIPITRSFQNGEHEILARISGPVGSQTNTEFTKTIIATNKPRILYISQQASGLEEIVTELYNVDIQRTIPQELDNYYAVILNDVPHNTIRSAQTRLNEYVLNGNGLLVGGGQDSYDFGGYQNTPLETLLPVRVGTGQRNRGGANIVFAMDLSQRSLGERIVDGERVEIDPAQNTIKALAIDVIEQLNPSNSVGAIGFTYPLPAAQQCTGACVIQDIQPLTETREELAQKIARVNITGGTSHSTGMVASLQLLNERTGSKNVIFFSDGVSGTQDQERALNAARTIASQGGRVYTVQVGRSEQGTNFMRSLAQAGGGVYFRADDKNRLAVLFGEPVEVDQGDAYSLVALNEYHFITQDLETQATLFGYNQVIPKVGSQELLTSNAGDPVLTVWNFGVGRVAALTGFNGEDYGQLLQEPNSQYISRTINWLIQDPQRLQQTSIQIPDGRVGEQITINVTSPTPPSASGITFERVEDNNYQARITPQEQGTFSMLGASYAVNYPREYQHLSTSQELSEAIDLTGGRVFTQETSAQEIIEDAKELSQLKQLDSELVRWPFIVLALSVLFIEIVARRFAEMIKKK